MKITNPLLGSSFELQQDIQDTYRSWLPSAVVKYQGGTYYCNVQKRKLVTAEMRKIAANSSQWILQLFPDGTIREIGRGIRLQYGDKPKHHYTRNGQGRLWSKHHRRYANVADITSALMDKHQIEVLTTGKIKYDLTEHYIDLARKYLENRNQAPNDWFLPEYCLRKLPWE